MLDTLECGISLRGNEVKSIIAGKASIKEAWCSIQNDQLVIRGMHITKWNTANDYDKRHALKEKQTKRDIARSIKQY